LKHIALSQILNGNTTQHIQHGATKIKWCSIQPTKQSRCYTNTQQGRYKYNILCRPKNQSKFYYGGHQMEQLLFILIWNLPFLAIAAYIEKNKWF